MSFRMRKGRASFSASKRGVRAGYRIGCMVPGVIVSMLLVLGACTTPRGGGANGPSACESAVKTAAAVAQMADSVEDLDPVIRMCATVADLRTASDKYPDAFDGVDPVVFVRDRCQGGGPADAPLCAAVK